MAFSGMIPVVASTSLVDEKRRVGRVQATYLTHLIKFTNWEQSDLPSKAESAKIIMLGEDKNGIVESFRFLASQTKMKIDGRGLEIIHLKNNLNSEAKLMLSLKPQVVFFLPESNFAVGEVKKLTPQSLLIGNGREFVVESGGDISFTSSKNRIRLVISKQAFLRKSPKLSSSISTLRNVVEIVPQI
ncbi:YfiR family protein [Opitutales bacterium]|nr:YfiR family protein [Opitutales bacterium]